MFNRIAISLLLLVANFGCKQDQQRGPTNDEILKNLGTKPSTQCLVKPANATSWICYDHMEVAAESMDIAEAFCKAKRGVFTANSVCTESGKIAGCTENNSRSPGEPRRIAWTYGSSVNAASLNQDCLQADESVVKK